MSEHLFEYVSIITLFIGVSIYLIRHKIKDYFSSPSAQISQASLGIKVKNGYISLLNILYHNSNKDDLEREIRYISTQRADGRYIGGYTKDTDEFDADSFVLDYFYEVLNYQDSKDENFIFSVDSNLNIEDLNNKLRATLGNIVDEIGLPFLINIDLENTLLNYQEKLNKHNIQMTFLSDGSDTYYFVLNPLDREKDVKKAIANIGLERIILN
jgi:hypothetical protein